MYEFTGSLASATDQRKALVVFIQIYNLFKKDENFHLDTFQGRINLFCLLLINKLGKDMIERHLLKCTKIGQAHTNQLFKLAATNMLIPDNFAELNLRTKFLWCATTKMHTLAMEGGHRQMCSVFNEVNIEMQFTPIMSFFEIRPPEFMTHRAIVVNESDVDNRDPHIEQANKDYYSRSKMEIRSNLYCVPDTCNGITVKLTKMLQTESAQIAVNNEDQANKTIETFLATVVDKAVANQEMISPYIPPFKAAGGFENSNPHGIEKTPTNFVKHNIRWFFETLAKEVKEPGANTKLKTVYSGWIQFVQKCLEVWLDPKSRTNTYQTMFITEKKKSIKKAKKTTDPSEDPNEGIVRSHRYISNMLLQMKERISKPNKYYSNFGYDPCITDNKLNPPPDIDVRLADNLEKKEWFYGFWAALNPKVSDFSEAPEKYLPAFKPAAYINFGISFGYSVYSQKTGNDFAKMLRNNGEKETKSYKGKYCHEVDKKEIKHVVRNNSA